MFGLCAVLSVGSTTHLPSLPGQCLYIPQVISKISSSKGLLWLFKNELGFPSYILLGKLYCTPYEKLLKLPIYRSDSSVWTYRPQGDPDHIKGLAQVGRVAAISAVHRYSWTSASWAHGRMVPPGPLVVLLGHGTCSGQLAGSESEQHHFQTSEINCQCVTLHNTLSSANSTKSPAVPSVRIYTRRVPSRAPSGLWWTHAKNKKWILVIADHWDCGIICY